MENKTQHTPGPWYINQFKGKYLRVSPNEFGCSNKDKYIAEQIKTEANARLIAAAPELLEALEEYVDEFETVCIAHKNPRYAKARAAIDKAKRPFNQCGANDYM